MEREAIRKAVKEAKEFLKRANAVLDDNTAREWSGNALTGALRRQSMELTRALAVMRKPWP